MSWQPRRQGDPRKWAAEDALGKLKDALDALPMAGVDAHSPMQGAWLRLAAALAATELVEPGERGLIVRPDRYEEATG